ncbi:putative HD superfamily hydrolase [Syntrophobacter sp. SbD1]|nr:putative HD superfamily hydrolase [Syntrophobacter sp. SbD1]
MKCPGQDSRFWGPEAISDSSCPNCGGTVEFFKDESSRKCRECGVKVLNPKMDFGCAAYCKFASQCLGSDMPPELLAKRTDLLKDRVAAEVKKFLDKNFKRIAWTLKVVDYAGKIQKSEGGDPAIVTLAARLSAISVSGPGFSPEDIAAAQSILNRAEAPGELAREVLSILKNLNGGGRGNDSANFRCVFDAILIAELAEGLKAGQCGTGSDAATGEALLTLTGKGILQEVCNDSQFRSIGNGKN